MYISNRKTGVGRLGQSLRSILWTVCLCAGSAGAAEKDGPSSAQTSTDEGAGRESVYGYPFKNMWGNFTGSFNLHNTLHYHIPAVASTVVLTATDWDYDIQYATQKYTTTPEDLNEAFFLAGWVAPVVISGGVYAGGFIADAEVYTRAGAAAIQAVMLNFVVSTSGKILTGRRGPDKNIYPGAGRGDDGGGFKRSKDAGDYNFAFWENFDRKEGRFFWPSGHTSSMFALAAAVTASTGDTTTGIISYSLAGYMGWAMIDGDHHWASDVIAGALIGHAIGWTVGMSYRSGTKLGHLKEGRGLHSFRLSPVGGPVKGLAAIWLY